MQLTEQEIQENIVKLVQIESQTIEKKKSLCRYYLRGLCIYDAENCSFSHGVDDLHYIQWNSNQVIEYDYLKQTDFCQKKTIKGLKNYKNLYDFQKQKIFTLQQLNQDRPKRQIIRKEFHRKMFYDFMKLLESKFPNAQFTEDFLIREYTRVGFNKLMTRIKFSHLSSHLCGQEDSEYYQINLIMPPLTKQQRIFIINKASNQEIDTFYKSTYEQIIKKHAEQTIDEGLLKKILFNFVRPIQIPPLHTYLKSKKCQFYFYLKSLIGQNIAELQIKSEADLPTLVQNAMKFLQSQLCKNMVQWNDVFKYLAKQHQINNGNLINQVKPFLVIEGFKFLFFPMTQFIIHQKYPTKINYSEYNQCPCNFKQIYEEKQSSFLSQALKNQAFFELQHKQSYDIYDLQTLLQCTPSIYNSKIIGVDLEGRLRKNGYIEMIQLNNERNTFLIDIYQMDLKGDVQAFQLTKKILRNVFCNQNILKIFHDCRHDSLALHQFMNCCVKNVYDTSASQTYRGQLQMYQKINQLVLQKTDKNEKNSKQLQQKAKEAIAQANNVKTPGLNEILKDYKAPHGINKNKELFHSMWNKGQTSLFDQRPLNPQFRQYCIKDVLDLPHVFFEMTKKDKLLQFDTEIAKWISSQYVKYGYLNTEEGIQKKQTQLKNINNQNQTNFQNYSTKKILQKE